MLLPQDEPLPPKIWYLDGFNLLHACVLKGQDRGRWWGEESQRTLLGWLADFPSQHQVSVFFDASRADSATAAFESDAEVLYAPCADDAIVERLGKDASPERICVVTADRALQERCRARRAQVLRPWAFEALLQARMGQGRAPCPRPPDSALDNAPQDSS